MILFFAHVLPGIIHYRDALTVPKQQILESSKLKEL